MCQISRWNFERLLGKQQIISGDYFFAAPGISMLHGVKVPLKKGSFMFYGPVVEDGYGVCYNPQSGHMIVCVASFRSWPGTDSQAFADCLVDSLRQMRDFCTSAAVNQRQWRSSTSPAGCSTDTLVLGHFGSLVSSWRRTFWHSIKRGNARGQQT